jgi:hypothetical protein
LDGIDSEEPESAAVISPSSDAIGSWTVTKKTLIGGSGHRETENYETPEPIVECALDLNFV